MIIHLDTFSSPRKYFSKDTFNNTGAANNERSPYSFISLTPFPKVPSTKEDSTGCINEIAIGAINEAAIGAIKTGRAPPSCFIASCSTV